MFQVLDHADVVYTGELSEATQYVIDHYGKKLDEAIRAGIKITYTDPLSRLNGVLRPESASDVPHFWKPVEEWELD